MRLVLSLVLLVSACAVGSVANQPPAQPSPCETIVTTYCTKGEVCGARAYSDCSSGLLPACAEVAGISEGEAAACSSAIVVADCRAAMPQACIGIAVNADPPTPPPTETLAL